MRLSALEWEELPYDLKEDVTVLYGVVRFTN